MSQKTNQQNLQTLQTLLRHLPSCQNKVSQNALLSLIYTESLPIARTIAYTILRKKNLYKSPNEIRDLCHDSCARLVSYFINRPSFTMVNANSYLYLMVQNELFNYQDKMFTYRHSQWDDELHDGPVETPLYGDNKEENALDILYENLGSRKREFVVYFGDAIWKNKGKKHNTRFKRAVLAAQHVTSPRFFYAHLDGLLALEKSIVGDSAIINDPLMCNTQKETNYGTGSR